VILATCVAAPLIAGAYLATPAPTPSAAPRFVFADFCRPEPAERLAFLVGLLLVPASACQARSRAFREAVVGPPFTAGLSGVPSIREAGLPAFWLFGFSQGNSRWLKPNSEKPRNRGSEKYRTAAANPA
jgi:hypothetical protein